MFVYPFQSQDLVHGMHPTATTLSFMDNRVFLFLTRCDHKFSDTLAGANYLLNVCGKAYLCF